MPRTLASLVGLVFMSMASPVFALSLDYWSFHLHALTVSGTVGLLGGAVTRATRLMPVLGFALSAAVVLATEFGLVMLAPFVLVGAIPFKEVWDALPQSWVIEVAFTEVVVLAIAFILGARVAGLVFKHWQRKHASEAAP
jgi:hypothetical protein